MEIPYLLDKDAKMFSPLALAYIGDAIYEIFVRSHVLDGGNVPVNKLHKSSTHYVSAKAQSSVIYKLMPLLTEEEQVVYKRGRNSHSNTSAKNADIVDYRHATGFEALLGHLFINKEYDRLNELVKLSFEYIENNNK